MSKHNDDNRSNQLNPNNDAYWSSRGADGGSDDDDDYGFNRRRSFEEISAAERVASKEREIAQPVYERFTFDFLCLDGRKAHFEVIAKLPTGDYQTSRISNCTDIFELFIPEFKRVFEREEKSPIEYEDARNGNGKPLVQLKADVWIEDEVSPFMHELPEKELVRRKHEKLLRDTRRQLIANFKKTLSSNAPITRVNVGEISVDSHGEVFLTPPIIN